MLVLTAYISPRRHGEHGETRREALEYTRSVSRSGSHRVSIAAITPQFLISFLFFSVCLRVLRASVVRLMIERLRNSPRQRNGNPLSPALCCASSVPLSHQGRGRSSAIELQNPLSPGGREMERGGRPTCRRSQSSHCPATGLNRRCCRWPRRRVACPCCYR